jgi:hypothetical protein
VNPSTPTSPSQGWVRTAIVVLAGAASLWAVIELVVGFDLLDVAPWALALPLAAVTIRLVWWRSPERRASPVLRIAFRLSSIAFALMAALGIYLFLFDVAFLLVTGGRGIGPQN